LLICMCCTFSASLVFDLFDVLLASVNKYFIEDSVS
jgi:hypothetical protein